MSMFCKKCGAELEGDSKFCDMCGNARADEKKRESVKSQNNPPRLAAALLPGETAVASALAAPLAEAILGPAGTLLKHFTGILNNFKSLFKDKKKLIPAIVLAVVWIALLLLQVFGINPLPVKLAAWLTFAQGGASNNIFRMLGGILGKGVFAGCFMWLFSGGYKSIAAGMKSLSGIIKQKNFNHLSRQLISLGTALILYNFMAGYAALIKSMAAVAAFLLVIRAIGEQNGLIRKLAVSLTATKTEAQRSENTDRLNSTMLGLAAGFALALPLSLIPWGYTPYCLGLAAIIAGTILIILKKHKKGGADL